MPSSMAQVEPLPFVPAAWMKRSRSCGLPASTGRLNVFSNPNFGPKTPTGKEPRKIGWPRRRSQQPVVNVRVRGGYETLEQRMRLVRLAQKLRVKLARNEKRMVLEFDDFHELAVGRQAAENKPGLFKFLAVGVVEFVAVAVAFVDHE